MTEDKIEHKVESEKLKDLYWSILVWTSQYEEHFLNITTHTVIDDFGNFVLHRVRCNLKPANHIDFMVGKNGQAWAAIGQSYIYYKFDLEKQKWEKAKSKIKQKEIK